MLDLFRRFMLMVFRFILSLRYRVRLTGMEQVKQLARTSPGRTLVLPNHPALVDPMILFSTLWPVLKIRPLVWEGNFQNPITALIGKLINALMTPDTGIASAAARSQAEASVKAIADGLERNENFILWPSGRLRRGEVEVLGGARALTEILQAVPDARIVLVRTRGLGGSRFGWSCRAENPNLINGILAGIGWCLASLILFLPRRRVHITLEVLDRGRLPELRRELINPWFEAWYNKEGPETPVFVPYHLFLGKRSYEFPKRRTLEGIDLDKIKPQTREGVIEILSKKLKRPLSDKELEPDTTLDELALDSLDRMDVNLTVERRFGFSSDQVPGTVGELMALAEGQVKKGPTKPAPQLWFKPLENKEPAQILGDTIAEAFVNRALGGLGEVAVADDLAGVLTYERMLVGAVSMSRRLSSLPRPNVGLMLPAAAACDIAFLALHLAGKLPVLLNWTTGPANLDHAARLMQLEHVITSKAFIDRTSIAVKDTKYLFLEELRGQIGKMELVKTLMQVRFFPGGIRRLVPKTDPEQPGVVLFTSGSEKAPKAVPLTHRNLLSNMKAALEFFGVTRQDSLLGFLPAFHSFGIAVTGLLPLLSGFRVVRHPDPTDASGLLRKLDAYKPTILAGTPTFVSYILERADPTNAAGEGGSEGARLPFLRLIVVGAEKCPQSVFDLCARVAPQAALLEGYGITECSPVVAANPPTDIRPGTIGKPLPGVEVCAIDMKTSLDSHGDLRFDLKPEQVLGPEEQGMLLVSGPLVFPGYIGGDAQAPFREVNGKRWYVTGDLGRVDKDGFIHFGGRLKRFLKIGGEMVSLPALEAPLAKELPATEKGPRVAVEGVAEEGKRKIVLFTTEPVTLAWANEKLEQAGFHGIMRLDEVRKLPAIPLLGTGKTDYKVLRAQIDSGDS